MCKEKMHNNITYLECYNCHIFFCKDNYPILRSRNHYQLNGKNYTIDEFEKICKMKAFI